MKPTKLVNGKRVPLSKADIDQMALDDAARIEADAVREVEKANRKASLNKVLLAINVTSEELMAALQSLNEGD